MIEIIEVSPSNEVAVARRLQSMIAAAWPDVAASKADRIVIAIGLRTHREIDLFVTVDLAQPRILQPRLRRNGRMSPRTEVQAAALIIELKQLDPSRFTVIGTQIFPDYREKKSRSVDTQIAECCTALAAHRDRYAVEPFFIHGIGWLTEVSETDLKDVNSEIVGQSAGWLDMLDAAAQQNASLFGPKSAAVRKSIAMICETLTRKRAISPRDCDKASSLCNDVLVDEVISGLAERAGRMQIRLTGHGGSGKTTTLALLAKRLAQIDEARVLILTFHKTLRGDIEHLIDSIVDVPAVKARICVDTAMSFFVSAITELGIALPIVGGELVFNQLPAVLASCVTSMTADEAEYLREGDPKRFGFDYVFIDEAQDWMDSERDFIRKIYGEENIVLADGLEQLVRRQISCDWSVGLPKAKRYNQHLGRSLRMTKNVAAFANAFARESGLVDWKIEPFEQLAGGRVIISLGGEIATAELARAIASELVGAKAKPVDALFCVPPKDVRETSPGIRESGRAIALAAAGMETWDASNPRVRDEVCADVDAWRVVQYDSCRGLEGWTAVAFGLDELWAGKMRYPNLAIDEADLPENVARRWLMIALTRAVHTLVITISDPNAPIVETLRGASLRLPNGVVEWTTGPELPAIVYGHDAVASG
jgi:hypothetical protein